MGVWEFLTKPRHFGTTALSWSEPWLYRSRLRGDLWTRLAMVCGLWIAVTGVLLVLFGVNVNPPGVLLAIGLGAVFGLGPGMLFFLMRRHLAGGSIKINAEGIWRHRTYGSFSLTSWSEWTEWPFDAIQRCVIVSSRSLEQSFSVMQLCVGGEWDIVGVPASIELKRLAQQLTRHGVKVVTADEAKPEFVRPLSLISVIVTLPVAIVVFVSGLGFYLIRPNKGGNARPERPIAVVPQPPDFGDWPARPEKDPPVIPAPGDSVPESANTYPPTPPGPGGFRGLPPGAPPPPAGFGPGNFGPPSIAFRGRRTELLGGNGGSPFERIGPTGQPVLGVRYRLGSWAGKQHVGQVEPLFAPAPGAGGPDTLLARDGYALGALKVDADEYVDALALVIMRLTPDGRLDPDDSYTSEWIGNRSENPTRTIGGDGARVIGICGRGAAVLDAVGLILSDSD